MFRNLKSGLNNLLGKITKKKLSPEEIDSFFDDLQLILLENDVAYEVTERIREMLKTRLSDMEVPRFDDAGKFVKEALYNVLDEILSEAGSLDFMKHVKSSGVKPYKVMFLGVNGVGKTTTIAKMAYLFKNKGFKVLLACADTFRAGAIEQLQIHASKVGVPVISQEYGADPAAVAFDAVEHARSKGFDIVFIDTAGRQHSNVNLMEELRKIARVIEPDFNILVVDSLAGNDALTQAIEFNSSVGVDGVIFTKVDADVKGGAILSVAASIKKPILYIGVGQGYGDLKTFDKEEYLKNIL